MSCAMAGRQFHAGRSWSPSPALATASTANAGAFTRSPGVPCGHEPAPCVARRLPRSRGAPPVAEQEVLGLEALRARRGAVTDAGGDARRPRRPRPRRSGSSPAPRSRRASARRATRARPPANASNSDRDGVERGAGSASGTTRCGTPSSAASDAQSRLWRSRSCITAAGSPSARARSIAGGNRTGSTSQTRPSAARACEVRVVGSSTIHEKPARRARRRTRSHTKSYARDARRGSTSVV